jgi:hypothetical protein
MQVSWIDPASLRAHLAALQPPAPQAAHLSHLAAGPPLDALVAGLTAPPPPAATPSRFVATPTSNPSTAKSATEPASPGPVPPAVLAALRAKLDRLQATAIPAPLHIDPRAPLGRRLGDFAAWAKRQPGVEEVLVLDSEGRLLWGPPQPAELVLAALMAMNAGRRSGAREVFAPSTRLQRPLAGDRQLSLLACSCQAGTVQLAVVHREPLSGSNEASLRTALTTVVDAAP